MLVDLKKLDEALKFVARANNLTLKGFLTGKGLQRGIIYYLKRYVILHLCIPWRKFLMLQD